MADGSCLAQSGNTQVLATVVVAGRAEHVHRHQHLALPLQVRRDCGKVADITRSCETNSSLTQVEYRERPSAAGRLPFGSHRREGLTDYEHLSSAILERALGPHFPPGFFRTVQARLVLLWKWFTLPQTSSCVGRNCWASKAVVHYWSLLSSCMQVSANVLSAGGDADPVILAINAASAALMCSSIPWAGPVGAVRVARSCGNLEATLSAKDTAKVDLTLLYAGLQNEAVLVDLQAGPHQLSRRDSWDVQCRRAVTCSGYRRQDRSKTRWQLQLSRWQTRKSPSCWQLRYPWQGMLGGGKKGFLYLGPILQLWNGSWRGGAPRWTVFCRTQRCRSAKQSGNWTWPKLSC